MDLVLATGNPNKRQELEMLLADLPVTVRSLTEFEPVPDIIEDGATCQANAKKKRSLSPNIPGC